MRRILILFVFMLICCGLLESQEFTFEMVFVDSLGNADTVELGYDENATVGLDDQFGEIDIIGESWDSIFEVRTIFRLHPYELAPIDNFHSKKQITKKDCKTIYPPAIEIGVKALHWPVTASWDPAFFLDSCNEGSLMTSIPSGGWWDVGSPSDLDRIELKTEPMVTFSDNVDFRSSGNVNPNYAYRDPVAGLISVFWVSLGRAALGVSSREINHYPDLQITPNPFTTELFIDGILKSEINQVKVYDIQGMNVLQSKDLYLSTLTLHPGVFILTISDKHGHKISRKVVKH